MSLLTLLLVSELVLGSVPRKRHPPTLRFMLSAVVPVATHALAFVLGLLYLVGHHSGVLAWWNVGDLLSQAPYCSKLAEQASVLMHLDRSFR